MFGQRETWSNWAEAVKTSLMWNQSSCVSPVSQGQYTFLHQCVRDVLRARKHRSEQENLLYPIYENFNPEYCRGESSHLS